jgi:hypothetical protein
MRIVADRYERSINAGWLRSKIQCRLHSDLPKFFLLTFAVTWTCFIAVAVAIPADKPFGYTLVLMVAYAPSYVALSMIAGGKDKQVFGKFWVASSSGE